MNAPAPRAVFLSYAREDTDAARRIAAALRAHGIEVWLDQDELRGGDAWDQKIRRQIKECALFVPLISANTHGRHEGYFRLEWKLAAERTHLMREGTPFLLPVLIDDTEGEPGTVPDPFLRVQWTRLPDGAPTPQLIDEVRRLLAAPRRGTAAPHGTHPPQSLGGTRGGTPPHLMVEATRSKPVMSRLRLVLAALVVAVAGLIGWRMMPAKPAAEKSIAVLAFANLSGDKENEYFSDGISEELLNVLAKVPGLRVCARTSAFFFKDKKVPIPEIAQKLGVAYIVEGSVQKSGSRVKITAQLINAAGFHLWADTFMRDARDIFAVQDEIAGVIAKNLQLKIVGRRVARPVNPDAHRLVLEARYHWFLRKEENLARAEAAVLKAIELDPQFAQAHAGLADVCAMRVAYRLLDGRGGPDTERDIMRGQTAARAALALDPTLADPYAALGYIAMVLSRFDESAGYFEKAIALNPNYAVAHGWYANLRASQGRLPEALVEYERSMELDPLWITNLGTYASVLGFAQRFDESLALTERVLNLRPGEVFLPSLATRGVALHAVGRRAEATEVARLILKDTAALPRWYADASAIWLLIQAGLHAEAEAGAQALFQRLPPSSYQRGFILVALGRFEEALPLLAHTPSRGKHRLFWDPMFDPWRENARFNELMTQLKCAGEYTAARDSLRQAIKASQKKPDRSIVK
ncbi:MAG: TIR domain-containing protein [Opitutaceae bacterium]|nr:TIR domain-containing protein [Opitutaceae bacterium]